MSKRFAATEGAVEKGLENTKPAAGAKLVQEWAAELEKVDVSGAKGIRQNLERLAKELEKDEPDSAKIETILGKLGPATVKIADKIEDEKIAEKTRHLGQALIDKGVESEDDEDDAED